MTVHILILVSEEKALIQAVVFIEDAHKVDIFLFIEDIFFFKGYNVTIFLSNMKCIFICHIPSYLTEVVD